MKNPKDTLRTGVLGVIMLFCIMVDSATINAVEEAYVIQANHISANLVLEKDRFMLGEPIYLSFVVSNLSDRDLYVIIGGSRGYNGRPERFTIRTVGENGVDVPQPETRFIQGGLFGPDRIPAKGKYEFRLFLPDWAAFQSTGSYTITASRILKLMTSSEDWLSNLASGSETVTTNIPAEATTQFTVEPLDSDRMGILIDQLGNEIFSEIYDDAVLVLKKMERIEDVRVIPYFLNAIQEGGYSLKFVALRVLARFNNDDAFEGLKRGLEVTGMDFVEQSTTMTGADSLARNIVAVAIHGIARSPHPNAVSYLITKRNHDLCEVRLTVVHALGRMNAEDARPYLEEMVNDEAEIVRSEAFRYLKQFDSEQESETQTNF